MSTRLGFLMITALLATSPGSSSGWAKEPVTIAPAPAGEQLSDDFEVNVDDQAVPVYRCRVSAVPLNQVWPGYQRPLDQTELASFAYGYSRAPASQRITKPVQGLLHRPCPFQICTLLRGAV